MRGGISRRNALRGAIAAAGGAFVGGMAPGVIASRPKRNLILICADALRGDRLGARRMIRPGLGRPAEEATLTPFLDELAAEGVGFTRALSPSSWTPVSVGSIFHGVSPMKVYYSGQVVAEGSRGSFVSKFAAAGYRTSAVVANGTLDQDIFRDGFEDFLIFPQARHIIDRRWEFDFPPGVHGDPLAEYLWGLPTGERVNSMVETLLGKLRRSSSFLLYIHYMDNHEIYTVSRRLLQQLGCALTYGIGVTSLREHLDAGRTDLGPDCSFQLGAELLEKYYDVSVRYLDEQVEALFAMLECRGLLDDTTVIFTSDHGEEFLDAEIEEERYFGHASNLSFAQTRTPLILASNAHPVRSGAIETPVENGAVVRAVAEAVLTGGDSPLWDAARTGREPPVEPVWSYLDWKGFKGLTCTRGGRRIHVRLDGEDGIQSVRGAVIQGAGAVADDLDDPAEARALAAAYVRRNRAGEGSRHIDERAMEQLKALGYLN